MSPSLGSQLLHELIEKKNFSYKDASEDILKTTGAKILRYSLCQWVNDQSHPNLKNALTLQMWSGGKITLESWSAAPKLKVVK